MDDETAVATVNGVAQVFDLHALKAFAPDKRVRKMLFKSNQLWSEIACYEPGQCTVMHSHPKEEEAIHALAFTHGPADVLAYMPAVAWRSGTGMVVWDGLA